MTLVLHEDAFGDSRNAQFLAKAAELAYLPSEEGKAAYLAELGLVADLISVHNTQAWIGSDQNNIVVAFRGTESPDKIEGLKDMTYGVKVGRKGGLLKALTLNALPLSDLIAFFKKN